MSALTVSWRPCMNACKFFIIVKIWFFLNYILELRHLSLPGWTNSQFSRSVPALGCYSLQEVSLEFNCKVRSFYEGFTFSVCFSKLFILLVSQSLVKILCKNTLLLQYSCKLTLALFILYIPFYSFFTYAKDEGRK